MKNLYEITDRNGKHICYQVAVDAMDAVSFARMYGHRSAANAAFVRQD